MTKLREKTEKEKTCHMTKRKRKDDTRKKNYLIQVIATNSHSADPDQLTSSEANWSGSSLFEKAGYIRVQQDKG